MTESELQEIVETICTRAKRCAEVLTSTGAIMKHANDPEFDIRGPVASIHRKKFPASYLPIVEPLLHITEGATFKYAIDIVGKMKGAGEEASAAVEAAWERTWKFDVPQACEEAFRALLRIGNNDDRLLRMANKAVKVDNYGIHKECANVFMKIKGGRDVLLNWKDTVRGQCDCHLHRKLAAKILDHVKNT